MDAAHLIAFNVALLAAWSAPGPALIYALRTALVSGRRAGVIAGVGLALAAATWTLAAMMGLETVFTLFPWAYAALKLLGAAYLLWYAWATWRSANAPIANGDTPKSAQHRRAFFGGVALNFGNPKAVLFAAAVLVVIFPRDLALPEMALVLANHFALEVLLYGTLATIISTPAVSRRYLALKPYFDRFSAAVMGALGIRLLLDRS